MGEFVLIALGVMVALAGDDWRDGREEQRAASAVSKEQVQEFEAGVLPLHMEVGRITGYLSYQLLRGTQRLSQRDRAAIISTPEVSRNGARRFERMLLLEDSGYTSANLSFGDVDGDGHLDAVLVKGRHWPLQNLLLLGDGRGSFAPARPVGDAADRSYSGFLSDLDGDGDLDMVVSNDRPDRKLVYLNDGHGDFALGSTFGRPEWPTRYITVSELNGDGHPDVVLANRYGDEEGPEYICFGADGGRFQDPCTQFAVTSATTITAADFDNDGDTDLAVPHRDGGQSRVHLNDGSGGFEETVPFGPADAQIRTAAAADLDGDGVLDLAVIDEGTGPATYRGLGGARFGDGIALGSSEARPYAIRIADVDEDGRPDILVGYVEARPVVYFNEGGGRFTAVPFGNGEGTTYGFAVGDIDEDGLLDIGVARSGAPNVLYFGESEPTG